MSSILFICTGNIFRSLTAEYSLRQHLGQGSGIAVSSAGTRDDPSLKVRSDVSRYLLAKRLDVSSHRRTLVTQTLLELFDHIVPMHTDHQRLLKDRFAIEVPHFMEACGMKDEALPDVDDLFAPNDWYDADAQQHIRLTIDRIVEMMPRLMRETLDRES